MIAQIVDINATTFSLNGKSYKKIFIAIAIADTHLRIVCAYDSHLEIVDVSKFEDIEVDGQTYGSLELLMAVLSNILFVVPGVGSGSSGIVSNTLIIPYGKVLVFQDQANVGETIIKLNDVVQKRISDTEVIKSAYKNLLADNDVANFGTVGNDYEDGNYELIELTEF